MAMYELFRNIAKSRQVFMTQYKTIDKCDKVFDKAGTLAKKSIS